MRYRAAEILALVQVLTIVLGSFFAKLGVEASDKLTGVYQPGDLAHALAFRGWLLLPFPFVWLFLYVVCARRDLTVWATGMVLIGIAFCVGYGLLCLHVCLRSLVFVTGSIGITS